MPKCKPPNTQRCQNPKHPKCKDAKMQKYKNIKVPKHIYGKTQTTKNAKELRCQNPNRPNSPISPTFPFSLPQYKKHSNILSPSVNLCESPCLCAEKNISPC